MSDIHWIKVQVCDKYLYDEGSDPITKERYTIVDIECLE
jgi:hypothetical protein